MLTVILAIYGAASNFSFEVEPDPETFIDADYDELAKVAYNLDDRYIDYHFPLNLTSGTTFVNDSECIDCNTSTPMSYANVSRWHFSDNEALWTGISYTGWTYKYLAAINEANSSMETYAREALVNMTDLFSTIVELTGTDLPQIHYSFSFADLLENDGEGTRHCMYSEVASDTPTSGWTARDHTYKLISFDNEIKSFNLGLKL